MTDVPKKNDAQVSASILSSGDGDHLQKRLLWLFRDALRQRRVHPLMDLLRQYRGLRRQ